MSSKSNIKNKIEKKIESKSLEHNKDLDFHLNSNNDSFHTHNKWRDKKGNSISYSIRSMCITAIMLALYMIFCYIGNTFFSLAFLADFLKLDFSLVFLIILVFVCKWQWWLFAGIVGGLANFLWGGSSSGYIGPLFNVVLNILTLSFLFLMKFVFIPKDINTLKQTKNKFHFGIELRILVICIITFFYSILINCLLNGIIFTPLYMQLYYHYDSVWFIDVAKKYNKNPNALLLFIPDYWTGIFALYSAFNAIKFGLVLTMSFALLILRYRTNIVDNYFLA